MSGRLTTHVLDTSTGQPAAGVGIEVWVLKPDGTRQRVGAAVTNQQGRTDQALDGQLRAGIYEVVFDVGGYFGPARQGFLEIVPIRFTVRHPADDYHVPLLVSPWSYSTYRGT